MPKDVAKKFGDRVTYRYSISQNVYKHRKDHRRYAKVKCSV